MTDGTATREQQNVAKLRNLINEKFKLIFPGLDNPQNIGYINCLADHFIRIFEKNEANILTVLSLI
jgi:hypothetical protein